MENVNNEILIDLPSIKEFNTNVILKNNELMEILDDMIEDFKELDQKFNSKAGAKYKDKILTYLQESRDKINQTNLLFSESLTKSTKVYEDAKMGVKNTVA